jgi:outer membrane protein OmpA-like peptidoglycan-associated protein
MKKFMISLAVAAIAMFSTANAQETVNEVVVPTKKNSVATNGFGSNWFLGVNGGVNLYNGVVTNGESPFDHLSPALNVYVGKWHTPGFGWRVAYQGLNIQAFEEADHAMYMNFHFDAMFNLSNLFCGYNEKRIWNFIPYVGVGWAGREAMNHEDFDDFSGSITANYGIINTFRVSKHWAINLELAGTFLRNGFSGVSGTSGHDMMWSANLGLTYKFNKVGWDNSVDVPALNAMHAAALAELMSQLNDAQAENNKLKNAYKALKNDYDKLNAAYNDLKNRPSMVDVKESIFFAFGSSKIASKKEQMNIEAYAKAAAEAGAKLRVIGYTDTIGSEEYNKGLAEARANAVAEVIKAAGVEVEVVAVGESSEHATKYLNRRAIIEVVK